MIYTHCGRSGLMLPKVSLGLWHNFGSVDIYENAKSILLHAFDRGITHFDLANNYGPVPGSAEITFGRVLKEGLGAHRDEMVISTKAGYVMWDGPYGSWGSRKHLIASLDQSLKRMGVDYVDIFYHHRPDPETPIEESMAALDQIVRSGKALYVGISNYKPAEARRAFEILREQHTPFIIHQARYNMFDRWVEDGLLDVTNEFGVGVIAFSPLAQGLLTNRYLNGIPEGSRMSKGGFLKPEALTDDKLARIIKLNEVAKRREQSLAEMALQWILRDERVTSVLVGASSTTQLDTNLSVVDALEKNPLSASDLNEIEAILK
ncbi:MAG: L-glyceraldehyde 3-phosphate reductase [Bacteroidales bacterium]|nr:L-glyceraldehyde 3-phosphate reductase [Bacteroidales bacterium]